MAFWSGVWVSVFLIAIVAVGSLLSPNAAERRSVSAIAIGSDSAVATQPLEGRGKVPLWLFGAIAITCGAGSVLVSRQLNASQAQPTPYAVARPARRKAAKSAKKQIPQPATRTAPRSTQPVVRKQVTKAPRPSSRRQAAQHRRQPRRLQPYSPLEPLFTRTPPGQPIPPAIPATIPVAAPIAQSQASLKPARSIPQVPVTVVPADQVHPLDWGEARLADAVDLRRKKSLQSWL